jgi:hypothetical protein
MLPRTLETFLTISIGGIGLQNLSAESALLDSEADGVVWVVAQHKMPGMEVPYARNQATAQVYCTVGRWRCPRRGEQS